MEFLSAVHVAKHPNQCYWKVRFKKINHGIRSYRVNQIYVIPRYRREAQNWQKSGAIKLHCWHGSRRRISSARRRAIESSWSKWSRTRRFDRSAARWRYPPSATMPTVKFDDTRLLSILRFSTVSTMFCCYLWYIETDAYQCKQKASYNGGYDEKNSS